MTRPESIADSRVAILGLGLMGGSLAFALRDRCQVLLAADPNPETLQLARQLKVVDQLSSDPLDILPQADMIVLAAPVRAILDLIQQLPALLPNSPGRQTITVIDLGSTKAQICNAFEQLPDHFDPIGGHPMCGKERGGLGQADGGLYHRATFALVPIARTSAVARSLAVQLVDALGAHPLWLEPAIHDRWAASTSHMPYLLSAALALATPHDSAPLVGPGFRSTSRLASSSPGMMADVLHTNRENVLAALQDCQARLSELESRLLEADETGLVRLLEEATASRKRLLESSAESGAA